LCEEICPPVFTLLDDGLAYVKDGDAIMSDPGGQAGIVAVPSDLEDAVQEASEECPGECIFIEAD
jgi:ferredoxin